MKNKNMQYGHFDDKRHEYVITRPDTPKSWTNYLGSTHYGSVITNNAGGYSFFKSAAQGRFMRARLNTIPMDQPGRYIYLHDKNDKDYWSASWQPVGKPLDEYKSECRHGTAYSIISSEYKKIKTETTYFVPLGQEFECWVCKVTNNDKKGRDLRLFTYVEYAGNWNAVDDMINLQFTQYTVKMDVIDHIIDHGTNIFIPPMPDNFEEKDQGRHTFMALKGAEITGYDTDRETFIGPYRDYGNPVVVEEGACTNSLAAGDNGCGTLQAEVSLKPGETKEIIVLVGIGKAEETGKQVAEEYGNSTRIWEEFDKLKKFWHDKISGMAVKTPDHEFDSMMNTWNPYNNLITFMWSRAASLVYNGERDGLGYRDSVQDFLGIMHNVTKESRERLELMITGQVSTGGALPVIKPFAHYPGKMKAPAEEGYRSDDCLWLFNAIPAFVKETGDIGFFDKVLPYADKGEDTVLGHMRKAIEFNIERSGAHDLPCGLLADWNDCLELGHDGETVFVAMQLRLALNTYMEVCEMLGKQEEIAWARPILDKLDNDIDKHCWDGNWYLRAFRYDGMKFGSKECDEGEIFLNPQSWSVISGHAQKEKAEKALQSVRDKLATKYGVQVCDPAFEKTDYTVVRATLMNKGMKENGGIFNHTQGWAVMAEAMLGNGNQAYKYYRAFMPAAYNTVAEEREIEPYVYSQSTHSKYSPRFGKSRVSWLSGTATWAYFSAGHYIMGVRPEYNGITIDPCIPSAWEGFEVKRGFRGKQLNIKVNNPNSVEKGVKQITVNGKTLNGNFVPLEQLKATNEIIVEMG